MSPPSRRHLLGAVGAATVGLAGCTWSSPVVRGGPTAPPPAPPPPPEVEAALRSEQALATVAGALATGPDAGRWTALAAAHTVHAGALARPDPVAPLPGPTPGPPGPAPTGAVGDEALWRSTAADARDTYREAAVRATGAGALLWGSLAAFAATAPTAGAVGAPGGRAGVATGTDVEAMTDLLAALHAAVAGYQRALVPLELGSGADDAARGRLAVLLGLRDAVSDVLAGRALAVPAAEPDYEVELGPQDRDGSVVLRRDLEVALLTRVGRWLATAADGDRALVVAALVDGTGAAVGLGAELPVWPGFGRG